MIQLARWKIILVSLATVLAIIFAAPNFVSKATLAKLPAWIPAQQLNLGLDLRGGAYLELSVDTAKLKKGRMVDLVENIRTSLNTAQIAFTGPTMTTDAITVTVANPAQLDAAFKAVSDSSRAAAGSTVGPDLAVSKQGANQIVATYRPQALAFEIHDAVARSIDILRRRIDPNGNKEISIVPQGADRIVLQAPGDSNPETLKQAVGKQAALTFQMVDESVSAEDLASGLLPPGTEVLPSEEGGNVAVHRKPVVTGQMVTNAQMGYDDRGQPAVELRFNGEGARSFGEATTQNVGKRFAIILDGQAISVPVIQGPIPGGSGQITGNFTADSASQLAALIKAGALPATLTVEDEQTTTAQLGQDAVNKGEISTAIGFAAIVVFMVLSYGLLFGGISVLGLVLNLLMMIAILSVNRAALTLPGIAGLILTLAVAVDANVLIYERIRDEERAGQSPVMAMEIGFKRASVSIFDANVTTLISGVIMFLISGEGPVKGFAWTLSVGVVTSVFTAMLVSQVLLGWWYRVKKPKQLPI